MIFIILLIVGILAVVHNYKCDKKSLKCPFHFSKESVETTVEVPAKVEDTTEILEDIVEEIESAE